VDKWGAYHGIPSLCRSNGGMLSFFRLNELSVVGWRYTTHTGIPWILTNAPNGVRSPAPLLGQHTEDVLRDVLRYRDEDIARLREQQVLY